MRRPMLIVDAIKSNEMNHVGVSVLYTLFHKFPDFTIDN